MCRMIAKVSSTEASITEEMFLCPTSLHYLSQNGRQPDTPWERGDHNDGCGLAFVNNESIDIHKRDKENSWDESYQSVVQQSRSKIFIAHNRLASKGLNTSVDAAHPFFYMPGDTPYALSHNGSIKTFMTEAKELGTSDSNILLRKIVDKKESNPSLDIADIVSEIAGVTDYNSMCAFLMLPNEIMIWRIYNEKNAADIPVYEAYYTLYINLRSGNVIVSSEPLDEGNWHLLPNKTFLKIKPSSDYVHLEYRSLNI